MKNMLVRIVRTVIPGIILLTFLAGCGTSSSGNNGQTTVNLGYYPNLTHAVALVGVANGTFQKELGSKVKLQTQTFNAGPSEIQALLAGSIDIAFVGPAPAVSGYTQSHGSALQVIAGASSGGVLFVVRANAGIHSATDLANKKIADPQKGGTQDVALRTYLQAHGLKSTDQGGNVQVISTDNANILNLLKTGQIDGAWVPEPWATRLLVEGQGKVFLNENSLWPSGQFATTVIVVRKAFYAAHPDIVNKFLQADVETVQYINANPSSAQQLANAQIKKITGASIKSNEVALAFQDLQITYDPFASTTTTQSNRSFTLGFVQSKPDLTSFYNLGPLNTILTSKGLAIVATK